MQTNHNISQEHLITKNVSIETMIPMMKECLATGQLVRFSPQGISMKPMLRPGLDSVILAPLPQKLKKYDIVLYQRNNGQYVLHRVIKADSEYTCMGDNQFKPEHGIRYSQMIAVVTAFYRKKKKYDTKRISYQLYSRIWYSFRSILYFCYREFCWIMNNIVCQKGKI